MRANEPAREKNEHWNIHFPRITTDTKEINQFHNKQAQMNKLWAMMVQLELTSERAHNRKWFWWDFLENTQIANWNMSKETWQQTHEYIHSPSLFLLFRATYKNKYNFLWINLCNFPAAARRKKLLICNWNGKFESSWATCMDVTSTCVQEIANKILFIWFVCSFGASFNCLLNNNTNAIWAH